MRPAWSVVTGAISAAVAVAVWRAADYAYMRLFAAHVSLMRQCGAAEVAAEKVRADAETWRSAVETERQRADGLDKIAREALGQLAAEQPWLPKVGEVWRDSSGDVGKIIAIDDAGWVKFAEDGSQPLTERIERMMHSHWGWRRIEPTVAKAGGTGSR